MAERIRTPIRLRFPAACLIVILLLGAGALIRPAVAAPTTGLQIVKYADNGTRVVNETTVTYQWMETHLPIYGDGRTHYYHQGPVFTDAKEEQWDRNETA
ncbi:MAG: hypothetical protein LUQ69_01760, partial [Methanoregulaceae archaeon]|nr:hypothetical protein [Methanoregulaceae archaeon]